MIRIFLILSLLGLGVACSGAHDQDFACAYPEGEGSDIVGIPHCGDYDENDDPVFTVEQAQRIRKAAQDHLICVITGSQTGHYRAFYIYNERRLETVFFDNGCDYFSEGLVRVFDKDKTAFADQKLNIVLRPNTVLAEPFHEGYAVVCNGNIKFEKVDGHVVQHGGVCGMIDHQGKLVVDMKYPHGDNRFEQYIIAHNGCTAPPITNANQALCHAEWQLRTNDFLDDEGYTHKVSEQGGMWQVILYPQQSQERLLVQVQSDTGELIVIERQPLGQKGTNM